jgi:hypothetical protein
MLETNRERSVAQLSWFPTKVHAPIPTPQELIAAAAKTIADTLDKPSARRTLNFLQDDQFFQLKYLATLLSNDDQQAHQDPTSLPLLDPATLPRVHPNQLQAPTHSDLTGTRGA